MVKVPLVSITSDATPPNSLDRELWEVKKMALALEEFQTRYYEGRWAYDGSKYYVYDRPRFEMALVYVDDPGVWFRSVVRPIVTHDDPLFEKFARPIQLSPYDLNTLLHNADGYKTIMLRRLGVWK